MRGRYTGSRGTGERRVVPAPAPAKARFVGWAVGMAVSEHDRIRPLVLMIGLIVARAVADRGC